MNILKYILVYPVYRDVCIALNIKPLGINEYLSKRIKEEELKKAVGK